MEKKLFCTNCGKELDSDVKFCVNCGKKVLALNQEDREELDNVSIEMEYQRNVENDRINKNSGLIAFLERIAGVRLGRKRIMIGSMFVAIICLLTGYTVVAVAFGIAGFLLFNKVYSKFSGGKKVLLLVGVSLCFCIGLISFEIKEMDNEYISIVEDGSFDDYEDEKIGVAFERFFEEPKWRYIITDDGKDVVEFTGKCKYDGVKVEVLMQFTVEEDETFEVTYLSYNEVTQNMLELTSLLGVVFDEYN